MRIQCADLSGYAICFHGCLYGTTVAVPEDEQRPDSENRNGVLKTGNNLCSDNVAGHTGDENVADCLVENKFDRNTRVGTAKHRSKRLLLGQGVLFKDAKVMCK